MEQSGLLQNHPSFNEDEWIRLIFLLSDTQKWINELAINAIMQVPMRDKKKLLRKTYYITVTALTHIIERHYYKIPCHPDTSKFTIPLTEILTHLRNASREKIKPVSGSLNLQRTIDTGNIVGIDGDHLPTKQITIITDSGGNIMTAFPGLLKSS